MKINIIIKMSIERDFSSLFRWIRTISKETSSFAMLKRKKMKQKKRKKMKIFGLKKKE